MYTKNPELMTGREMLIKLCALNCSCLREMTTTYTEDSCQMDQCNRNMDEGAVVEREPEVLLIANVYLFAILAYSGLSLG